MQKNNKSKTELWNEFVSALVEYAALPKTSIVRLTFTNSEGIKHEINNDDELNKLALSYGIISKNKEFISIIIDIEVLALSFGLYAKRFKFEQNEYIKKHNINVLTKKVSERDKQLLAKFKLSALTSTKATVRRKIKIKSHIKNQDSQLSLPSINIMDMLNLNPPKNNDNESKSNAIIENRMPTTMNNVPSLISFEEMRFKHYANSEKWIDENKEEDAENVNDECTKLVIGNWPNAKNEGVLKSLFSTFGLLKSASIVNGCGIVEYCEKSQAQQAMEIMNGVVFGQSTLAISYATEQQSKKNPVLLQASPSNNKAGEAKENKKSENEKKRELGKNDVEQKEKNSDNDVKEKKRRRKSRKGKKKKDEKNKILFDTLNDWGLEQYANVLIVQNGFDDISDWQDITEPDLLRMNFLLGHARKFLRKAKEYFDSNDEEAQIEGHNENAQMNNDYKETAYI